MKKIYWRPQKISQSVLVVIAVFALSCLITVERLKTVNQQPYYKDFVSASRLAQKAFSEIKTTAEKKGIVLDLESDPIGSGLVGTLVSPVTSDRGYLYAKQTSINPNFAAVAVDLLKDAGVKRGDYVALGISGSLPAMNIAVYAAMQVMGVKPIVISSAGASQWGANNPDFTWLDMESELFNKQIFSFKSVAASLGGIEDRGLGMTKKGKTILKEVIERNGVYFINSESVAENLAERMNIFLSYSGGDKIKAYVNIGGGTVSVGKYKGKTSYKPGLNNVVPRGAVDIDSVMTRFNKMGVPVLHLVKISLLAEKYGLPFAPTTMPRVGEGKIYFKETYNRWLAVFSLLAILLSLYGFIRSDLGYRIFQKAETLSSGKTQPKQMV